MAQARGNPAYERALPRTTRGYIRTRQQLAAGPTSENTLKFSELELPEPLLQAVADLGWEQPTAIQEQGLPLLIEGRDLCGQAQTGTGKTACFLLATMKRMLDNPDPDTSRPRALIVAPTRELAMQIASDGVDLGKHTDFVFALAYGGTKWETQAKAIRDGADIIVGTPGRLIDYHKRKVLDLSNIEVVVIDEADRLFDMGFIADLTYLMRRCPSRTQRQTLLFSATLSYEVQRLARQHMNKAARVEIAPDNLVVDSIEQSCFHVAVHEKFELLMGLIQREQPTRAMVFVNRKVVGEEIAWRFNQNGYTAVYLSGDLPQGKRTRIIAALKDGRIDILVATDVASRGIHVDDISHVFNFDVPQDPEDYVHRIGRTARAGKKGTAITLACDDYVYCLAALEKYTKKKIPTEFAEEALFIPDRAGRFRRQKKPYTGLEAIAGEKGDDDEDGDGRESRRDDRGSRGSRGSDRGGDQGGDRGRRTRSASASAPSGPPKKKKRRKREPHDVTAEANAAATAEAEADAPPKKLSAKAKAKAKKPKAVKTDAVAEADAKSTADAKPARPKRKRERRRIGDGGGIS